MGKDRRKDKADEDERIWMGTQIAALADKAYKEKDKIALDRYIQHGDRIAPKNPKLRKLKETIHTEETIVPRAFGAGV